jgi:polysaccharide export outer membrane protein
MEHYKKYLILTLSLFPFYSFGQAIDPSMLSQLSPEQIEMAKDAFANQNSIVESVEKPLVADESLVEKKSEYDANEIAGKKFGYDFFASMPTSLTAVGDLPLPNEYKISLRDEFTIILSGSKNAIFNLNVKLDGTILFPELGSVNVVGNTFEEVKDKLTRLIEQSYIGVNIDVSLQNLSAKKITIVGAVKTPGTYLVNPFSTITGALAYSGGISEIGSLRDIKLIRSNGKIYSFDLYDLLIKGNRSNDITIEAGDTILITPASQFVEIKGAVKRPAIYEILQEETINDIVEFALGFENTANKSNISVSFLDLKEASVVSKTTQNLDQSLNGALSVTVFNYVSEQKSNILVNGAIEQPGFYDIEKYKNLEDLIADLKFINVYPWAAVLEQFNDDDLIKTTLLFSLNDPETYKSVKLLPNSRIYFADKDSMNYDISDMSQALLDEYALKIFHKNNIYELPVYGKYRVISFTDFLGLDMDNVNLNATYISPLDDVVNNEDYRTMQYTAKKFNVVQFRTPVNDLIQIEISGAIDYPGIFTLKTNTSIEDLYNVVGNFKQDAFLDGIIFKRESIKSRQVNSIEKSKNELNRLILTNMQEGQEVANIDMILALTESIETENLGRISGDFTPNSTDSRNTILIDGDSIFVPRKPNIVNVFGEVLNPTAILFNKNLTIDDAIDQAGGFHSFADKKRVYVIKSNGLVKKVSKNIFVGRINLEEGDSIIVPRKIVTTNPVTKALLPVTQILSDLAFSAAAIESLSNN